MSRDGVSVPPLSLEHRASGVLLHVTSLPSPYGIGDLGPIAMSRIDRLDQAGQSWWQALPLGPTGYGNSPYQPLSSFAGNALVISPDWLIEDELWGPSDCAHPDSLRPPLITTRSYRLTVLPRVHVNLHLALSMACSQRFHADLKTLPNHRLSELELLQVRVFMFSPVLLLRKNSASETPCSPMGRDGAGDSTSPFWFHSMRLFSRRQPLCHRLRLLFRY